MLLAAIQAGRTGMLSRVSSWLERQLGDKLFRLSIDKDLVTPLNIIRGYLTSPGFIALVDLPWSLLFIAVLFVLHLYIGLIALLGTTVIVVMAYLSHRYSKNLFKDYQDHRERCAGQMRDAQHNADILKSMGGLDAVGADWKETNERMQNLQLGLAKRQTFLAEAGKFFRLSLQIAVTGIGAYLVLKNQLTVGGIIVGSTLLGRALAPIEVTLATWTTTLTAYHAYRALAQHETNDGDVATPDLAGDLRVDGVSFVIGPGVPILRNIDFLLEQGKMLAVMGHNGAGKSTLARLVVGLLSPTPGKVTLNGYPLNLVRDERSRGRIGYLPQSTPLFPGTAARIIARMSPSPDMHAVKVAAELSGANTWIESLPRGYDTPLDPKVLSAGQRQQLGLARAWYNNPMFLVLDEPDAFLDQTAQGRLVTSLAQSKESGTMTIVVITHHPEIIHLADCLLLLQGGEMTLFGDREEVLGKING